MAHETEFFEAVRRGDASTVADLLRSRPELAQVAGEHGKTGLHWAAETNQADVARILLDAGADMDAKTSWDASPLEWAATMGSGRVADLLLSRGAGGLTFVVAAALGKLEMVKASVESGADLSARGAPPSPDDHWPADSARVQGDVLSHAMYCSERSRTGCRVPAGPGCSDRCQGGIRHYRPTLGSHQRTPEYRGPPHCTRCEPHHPRRALQEYP